MKKLLFAAHVLVALALVSCNPKTEHKAEEKTEAPMTTEAKKIEVKLADLATNIDLNCEMPLEEGSIADTASYEGKLYGFCDKSCKAEFEKNPTAMLAKLKK